MKRTGNSRENSKAQIVRYIQENGNASKVEISKVLNLSMPTVLQNTKELLEQGIVEEAGEYESTGGRKAKSLVIHGDAAYALGLDITCLLYTSPGNSAHVRGFAGAAGDDL